MLNQFFYKKTNNKILVFCKTFKQTQKELSYQMFNSYELNYNKTF
jgi:hypothetical protein